MTFNVTNRPPTNVVCTLDGNAIEYYNITRTFEVASDPILVSVVVVFSGRNAGTYQCDISTNAQASTNTTSLDVEGI